MDAGQQLEATTAAVLTHERVSINQVNHPPRRYPRQQEPNTDSGTLRVPLRRGEYYLRGDRTRLPELGEKVIEVRPMSNSFIPNGLPDALNIIEEGQTPRQMNRDSPKISMLGCDGLERGCDPRDV